MKHFLLILLLVWSYSASAHNYSKEEILNDPDAPAFAKLSVQPNVNYYDVLRAFEAYEKLHPQGKLKKEFINSKGQTEEIEMEETDGWRFYFKRWNSRVSGFVRADGSIANISDPSIQQYVHEKQSEIKARANNNTAVAAKPTGLGWRLVGPKVVIAVNAGDTIDELANIYCVQFSQSNPSIGYCGTETGCIFKTTDGGENWNQVGTGMIFDVVRSLAIDPTNADIVYAGDADKIHKSIDGGLTWTTMYMGVGWAYCLLINPLQPQTILVGAGYGVYQSYDGGATFTLRESGKVTGMEYRPGDTTIVYAYITKGVATANYSWGNYNAHVFKSVDGGQSFTIKPTGWFNYAPDRKYTITTGDITVSAANPNVVYALLAGDERDLSNPANNRTGEIGVLKSTDAGETWNFAHGPFVQPNLMTYGVNSGFTNAYWQGDYNNWIITSPANADQIIVGGVGGFRSVDGGVNWSLLLGISGLYTLPPPSYWRFHPDHQNFFMSGSNLWIANDGGLLKSGDFLATPPTAKCNGIYASEFWGFGVGWNHEIVTGGLYHNGVMGYYANVNPVHTFLTMGGAEPATGYISPYEPKAFYSEITSKALSNTFPFASDIANLSKLPNESYGLTDFSNLIYHANKINTLYLGKDNSFWRSNDGGQSFLSLYTFTNRVADFDIPLSAPDTIMLTTVTDYKIWLSTNGGVAFTDISGSLPFGPKKLSMNPVNAKECWVLVCGSGYVYRTTDLGTTWVNVGGGNLTGKLGYDMFVQGSTTDPTCYVACNNGGVFYKNSTTGGNWTVLDQDLPAKHGVRRLEPFYAKNKMFFGTSTIGIWEHDLMAPVQPFANFASNRQATNCGKDTLLFYDHSIVDESVAAATRTWSFPGAVYVNVTDPKHPRALYNTPGNYNVTLTITDANNNSHTRTINNFITFGAMDVCKVDTVPGLALSADNSSGTEGIDIGSAAINSNTFTISAWVKPIGSQQGVAQILGTRAPNTYFGIGFSAGSPNLNLIYSHSATPWWTQITIPWWQTSTINLDPDTWNYITLVYTPTGVTIYKNGQAPGWSYTSGTFGNVDFSSSSIYINPDLHSQGVHFNGEIDEMAFYNTALTLPQIREYMHLTKNEATPNLVKYIQFNQYSSSENVFFNAIGSGGSTVPPGNIVASNAPVGSGSVQTIDNVNTAGTYDFGSTGLSLTLPSGGTYPNGTLVGFKLNIPPDTKPSADSTFPHNTYWVMNNYGLNTNFTPLSSIKFSGLYKNPAYTYSDNEFKLYKRSSTTFGNTWGAIQDVSDLVTVNPNNIDVTFSIDNNITSFSQLVLTADNPIALPIKTIKLTARLAAGNNTVKLDGYADMDEKIQKLTMERMSDNQTKIVAVEDVAAQQSSTRSITRFDNAVQPGNKYYYRLIATSVDGKSYYSTYQSVNVPLLKGVFNAYPNPADDWITFTFSSSNEATGAISIHDVAGRLVMQLNAIELRSGNNNIMCNIQSLANGIYEATLTLVNGEAYHVKISKGE